MKLTKKQLRKLIKESIDHGYHYDVLQPLIDELKKVLFDWYVFKNQHNDYEHHIPEPGLIRMLNTWLDYGNFRNHIKMASLETGMRPKEVKDKTIEFLLNSPELTSIIIADYSDHDQSQGVYDNDEYYSSRVYRF